RQLTEEGALLDIGKDQWEPVRARKAVICGIAAAPDQTLRQHLVGIMVAVKRDAELFEVVAALSSGCRLAHFTDCGQQETNQNGDDGDHDQQLDQGERVATWASASRHVHAQEHGSSSLRGGASIGVERFILFRVNKIEKSVEPKPNPLTRTVPR